MGTIRIVQGDITTAKEPYICHQVNCSGAMNSGVARAIRQTWPIVYTRYKAWCAVMEDYLGENQYVPINETQTVINMFAQERFGYDGKRYTDYEAFAECLEEMDKNLPLDTSIAFPWKIASDRGGANWEIIKTMIIQILCKNDREIVFYKLGE